MMSRLKNLIFVFMALFLPIIAFASKWQLDDAHTRIGFEVNHMGYSTTYGYFKQFDGVVDYEKTKPEDTSIHFIIKAASINTDWVARDEHLKSKDFFNVTQFPDMKFVSKKFTLIDPSHAKLIGDFTLLGITKPITLDVKINKQAISPMTKLDTIGFQATTTIKRSDWGMNFLIPAISDEVVIKIDSELNPFISK
ncbi:YceI family protein [Neisseria sp. Ec49-e6-T10]|uniref:YceI family protein n=1 Tax=Neisseria sp. Ec49-e6-T10 TaxID=3140744 RepID=UPI003EC0517C